MHLHHILPKHAGGTNDSSNLVEVSITCHAMFHFCNWQLWKREGDKIAWKALTGQMTKKEATARARRDFTKRNPEHHSLAGKKGGKAPASELNKKMASKLAKKYWGSFWWTNGEINKRSPTQPGPDFYRGRLPNYKNR